MWNITIKDNEKNIYNFDSSIIKKSDCKEYKNGLSINVLKNFMYTFDVLL